MTVEEHAGNSAVRCGFHGLDIHRWIDGYFDPEVFSRFLESGSAQEFDPYEHRFHRHCREALADALSVFSGTYPEEVVKAVFESHLMDDYDGYIPLRSDFDNPRFLERYHDLPPTPQSEKVLSEDERNEYFRAVTSNAGSKSFFFKIFLPTVISVAIFAVSLLVVIEPVLRSTIMDGKKRMLRELVATAVSVLRWYHDEELSGMETDEARGLAIRELEKTRYGSENKDYFWIIDSGARMIMHPYRQDLMGDDVSEFRDSASSDGTYIFEEAAALALAEGQGFIEYRWQLPDDPQHIVPKLSFIQYYPEWDWIIGTGVYIDNVDEEMDRITNRLLAIFGSISALSVAILSLALLQAHRSEKARHRAEESLEEARDRYRALSDISREGYVLFIGGKAVYSNPRMRELSRFSEEDLVGKTPEELFLEETDPSGTGSGYLLGKDGKKLPVIITSSRAYFSRETGTVYSVKPRPVRVTDSLDLSALPQTSELKVNVFSGARTEDELYDRLSRTASLLSEYLYEGRRPQWIRRWITSLWDSLVHSLIGLLLEKRDKPPRQFVFLALGSSGRGEMTLFSDQDNAIVYSGEEDGVAQEWFLAFAEELCACLDRAGFRICPGGIVAKNSRWCMSLTSWNAQLGRWIAGEEKDSVQNLHVFSDARAVWGERTLFESLSDSLSEMVRRTGNCVAQFASPLSSYPMPALSGDKSVNIKQCLLILETFARIYSFAHGITERGSTARMAALEKAGIIQGETVRDYVFLFEYLWKLRFQSQLANWDKLEKTDDDLYPASLTASEKRQIKVLLHSLPIFVQKAERDFLGGIPVAF